MWWPCDIRSWLSVLDVKRWRINFEEGNHSVNRKRLTNGILIFSPENSIQNNSDVKTKKKHSSTEISHLKLPIEVLLFYTISRTRSASLSHWKLPTIHMQFPFMLLIIWVCHSLMLHAISNTWGGSCFIGLLNTAFA